MRLFAVLLVLVTAMAGCNDVPAGTVQASPGLPPIGLAATARWLADREAYVPRRPLASEIPTEDLCDIVDDCVAQVAR